jgi:hypothetical protein
MTPWIGRIALVLAEHDPFAGWYEEAAAQSGLLVEVHRASRVEDALGCRVICLCGVQEGGMVLRSTLVRHAASGGAVVVSGSTWGLASELGLASEGPPDFGRGHMSPLAKGTILPDGVNQCLFFGGARRSETTAKALARGGHGECLAAVHRQFFWFAPHLGRTLGMMAMGRAVEGGALSPGDGTCTFEDGLATAEKGTHLRLDEDRTGSYFGAPWADWIREAWTRMVLMACHAAEQAPILFGGAPMGYQAIACLSAEADPLHAHASRSFLKTLGKYGLRAGWLSDGAGMPGDLVRSLKSHEHSFGLLFAGHGESFCDDQLRIQMIQAGRPVGSSVFTCSRPLDGGWQGWDAYYEMMEKLGARASLSKGGRQVGTTGFLFGTAHPFFVRKKDGTRRRVLEVPYAAMLPTASEASLGVLAAEASRSCGVFHVAVDLADDRIEDVDRAIMSMNMAVRQNRLLPMTPDQAVAYVLAVRSLRVAQRGTGLTVASEAFCPGLTILSYPYCPLASGTGWQEVRRVRRFGADFSAWTADAQPKQTLEITAAPRAAA